MPRQDISFPLKDADLREDVHMLGMLIGEVIREQGGDALFELVESNRQAAIARSQGDGKATAQLIESLRDVPADSARDVVRAFSTWFEMVNMAEKVHRIRRRRQYMNEGAKQPGGIEDAIAKLKAKGMTLAELRRLMLELWIEPVLTAHPTESTRRTLLRKQQKVAQLLLSRIGLGSSATEMRTMWERVRAEITSGWQTAENSRERLSIADEREHVLFFIAEVLYQIVPIFYEEITTTLEKVYGPEARGVEVAEILRFGSWVGGDMDGNPDVHAKTIRETIARHQQLIVNNYFLECQALQEALSQSAVSGVVPRQLWQILYARVRGAGAPIFVPLRADTADRRCLIDLELYPAADRCIQHVCECVWEEARPAVALLDSNYPRDGRQLVRCAWCARIQLALGVWAEVEDAHTRLQLGTPQTLPSLTDGVCTPCKQSLLRNFPVRVA